MEGDNSSRGIIAAIVFAALVVSGSLVFLGMQISGSGMLANVGGADDDFMDAELAALIEEIKNGAGDEEPAAPDNTVDADLDELVDDDPILGDEDAPITLVEFSDYECPFCQRHFTQTVPQIVSDYVNTGKVRYVFRDYPLSFHAQAKPAAVAAECAREQKGDEAYFEMNKKLFEGGSTGLQESNFLAYAAEMGLNESTFKTCLADPSHGEEVDADMTAGSRFGVRGTPGFVISNGETSKLVSGAQPYAIFKAEIDALLNE